MISEDEFFDAVDATLDKLEKEEDKVCLWDCSQFWGTVV